MAYVNTQDRNIFAARPAATPTFFATLRERLDRYRLYRRTVSELQALSGRELADLGLSRSMIPGVAREAAYGDI